MGRDFRKAKLADARPGDSRSRIPPGLTAGEAFWLRSDRFPRSKHGGDRGYVLLSENPTHDRETLIHRAAIARLRYEFMWPRDQLAEACPACACLMPAAAIRSEVVVEVKRNAALVDELVREMRECPLAAEPAPTHTEHNKCRALGALYARVFLAVAAADTWRLFTVVEREGRRVLGDELTPDLRALRFDASDASVQLT